MWNWQKLLNIKFVMIVMFLQCVGVNDSYGNQVLWEFLRHEAKLK